MTNVHELDEMLNSLGITLSDLNGLMNRAMVRGADDGDLYLQSSAYQSWALEDGQIKEGSYDYSHGMGVRVVRGETSGFSFTNEFDTSVLNKAADAANSIVKGGQVQSIDLRRTQSKKKLYEPINPIKELKAAEQVNLLHKVDAYARQLGNEITQVDASVAMMYETVAIINAEGRFVFDSRPLVRFNVQVVAERNNRRESGYAGGGGRISANSFLTEDTIKYYTQSAVNQAVLNLEAVPAPAGSFPVVLGPGWPGVLLHEAIGHGLEADFNRKGSSAFSNRLGESVASPLCTVVDNGTLEGRRGSLNVDDEGTPTQETVLIERGVLKGYMQDKLNARLMDMQPTGNARRESYAHLPIPRMTNTYLMPGQDDPQDMIKSIKKGIYALNFSGGQVEISSGKFVFTANEAYLIENGEITQPIKNASLIGNGPDILTRVSMVGHDMALDSGIGVCGKEGQSVPVGVGQPSLKIDELTIGGSS